MVAKKLQNFGGMIPAIDRQLLPEMSADFAKNTWLYSGAIQGFKGLRKVHTLANAAAKKTFRIPIAKLDAERIPNSYWLEFTSPNTDVVRSPASGDQFERYYIATDNDRPRYVTRTQVVAHGGPGVPSSVSMTLGVPAPETPPSISVTGGSAPNEARAYVYTWVTAYGEEGPPSLPTLDTDYGNGTWTITMTAPTAADVLRRQLTRVRIYRTVSGVGGETDYFFVAEQAIADLTFDDTIASVTGNPIIRSLFWTGPPVDLRGFVSMPNGMIASWRANEIWFCEPYRPHAWPVGYQISVDSGIVGLGVIGQTLIVCTEVAVFAVSGINPASMSQSRLAGFQPCMSRNSIVSTPAGVAFASPNGLILANPSGVAVITRQMLQKEDWAALLYLPTVVAATFNSGYYAFGSTAIGCFGGGAFQANAFLQQDYSGAFTGVYIEPNDPRVAISALDTDVPVRNVYSDIWTDEVFIHRDDGVFWLDQTRQGAEPRQPYIWKSKVLELPAAGNFQAMRVYFSKFPCSPAPGSVSDEDNFNFFLRNEYPGWFLASGAWATLGQWNDAPGWDDSPLGAEWQAWEVSAADILYPDQLGIVRVYADGVLRFSREILTSGVFFRLPSGFKATGWQIEIEARVKIESVEIAETARELGSV